MSTSRAGRGTLKRVAIPETRKKKGTREGASEFFSKSKSNGKEEEGKEKGKEDDCDDERVAIVKGFTGLGRASCLSLLKRVGGDVEAAVNAHFVTLSPPPKKKKPVQHEEEDPPERQRKSSNQLTLAQSGFAALAPAFASAQSLTVEATATATLTFAAQIFSFLNHLS